MTAAARTYLLAGDIGATKTALALFQADKNRNEPLAGETVDNGSFAGFEDIIDSFLNRAEVQPEYACFGVAGPVSDNRVKMTNLDWTLDGDNLQQHFGIRSVTLINDLVATAMGAVHLQAGSILTLSYLKQQQANFVGLYANNKFTVIAAYMLIYIIVTALSLPGAAVMTLAGGCLFGLVTGTLVVSFASTIGATCACIVARYLLRDWVQNRFGDKLAKINRGVEKEGGFYLFSLRLVPVFPFFVINLVMGLTPIRISTYYWVSQIGMLPGTIVYVNAGRELAKLDSLKGILSARLLISFALLGLFPIITKKLLGLYKARRETTP